MNVGKKLQMIQVAFAYMGKPAVFNQIMGRYPDMQMLFEYAKSNMNSSFNRRRWCDKNKQDNCLAKS